MKRIFLAGVILGLTAHAQQPVFQSETKLVLVDTVVTTKKGDFVRDLTAKDFSVREDNKERAIRSFSLESAENHSAPHRFVLFFDNSNTSIQDQIQAYRAAGGFVEASAGSSTLFAAVTYDGVFRVAQSFTDNPARLKQSLSGTRLNSANLANQLGQPSDRVEASATSSADLRGLLQSMGNLAQSLGALSGRKTLILFSTETVFSRAREADFAGLVKLSNRSNVAIYPILSAGPPSSAAGQNCSQRNPGEIAPPKFSPCVGADASVSDALARGTGGFISTTAGDLPSQLKHIGGEELENYVIGFEPLESDGKNEGCHELKVKVNRPGVSLRARSGYCATKQMELPKGSKVERDLEKHAASTSNGPLLTAEVPFFYTAPNVATVHVAMQIPAAALRFETVRGRAHIDLTVLGVASGPDGSVAARFSDVMKRDYDNKPQYVDYRKEFRIVAGQYKLTLTFTGGADFGKAEVPLSIEPFDRSGSGISGIVLGTEVLPAANIGLDPSSSDEGTPLIAGGMQLIQSSTRRFQRNKSAFCYFEVYSPRAAQGAIVRVRILDVASGAEKWDGGERMISAPAPGTGVIPVGLAIPIAGLAPGIYRIEASARNADGGVVKRSVDIELQ